MARIIKKNEVVGVGALVQLIGLLVLGFGIFVLGDFIITGAVMLGCMVAGARLSSKYLCPECRGKVDKKAKVCQHCAAKFG